jgi:hypothetical protein
MDFIPEHLFPKIFIMKLLLIPRFKSTSPTWKPFNKKPQPRITHKHKHDRLAKPQRQTFQPNNHQMPRIPDMPTDNLADACGLGCEVPIRPRNPRNPHRRGTAKYTKRQNLNRNLRLHLQNDRKTVRNDSILYQDIQDTHYNFYCTLSSFDQWNYTRQVLSHDRTLINQWPLIFCQGKTAALRFAQFPDTQNVLQIMTRILVQHVKCTLTIAESGALIR